MLIIRKNIFKRYLKDIQYVKLYVLDVVKDMNIKVFNLMSRTNEIRYVSFRMSCRLDASVCNDKQRWNNKK